MLPELQKYDADVIIADEGHKLKEGRTSQSKGMHKLGDKARYRLLLTGTPVANKELDIFSQYRFVNSDIFGKSFIPFRNRYFYMGGYEQHEAIFKKSMTGEFLEKLHSIAFRVTKDDEEESWAEMKESEVTASNMLTRILRLSQITGGFLNDDDGNVNAVSKAKLEALSDIIDGAVAAGEKLVIMARFRAELDAIQQMVEKKRLSYGVVRGGISDRAEQVSRFQNDPDCMIFIGQIQAAGMGLTLTAASTMVFYSCDYSMSNFDQAKSRIHRAGQKNNCLYIYLVVRNSIDGKVLKALRDKQNLAKMLVDDYRAGRQPFK